MSHKPFGPERPRVTTRAMSAAAPDQAGAAVASPVPEGLESAVAREAEEQNITPWEVQGADGKGIDYDKLVEKFGCQKLDDATVARVERLTGVPAHPFLKRGIFFAVR